MHSTALSLDEDDNVNPAFNPAANKSRKVLGKATLSAVHLDMTRTLLPSWVSPVPSNVGETKAGKLTADQWKTFCTVHLVVSLPRLWGDDSMENDRFRRLLENFMKLVTAVKLASMRVMTIQRADLYHWYMHEYLTSLRVLFPENDLVPNQHNSLHLSTFLKRFGPVHSWRTFVFERYNYLLQNIPTNQKFGMY